MSVPLELLYELTARDAKSALWGPLITRDVALEASVDFQNNPIAPAADRLFFIRSLAFRFQGAAAQLLTFAEIIIRDRNNNFLCVYTVHNSNAGATPGIFGDIPVDFVMTSEHEIAAHGSFDAGVFSNRIELGLTGYVVPKGNVALF